MDDFFYTIDSPATSLYKEKGSKFIGCAMPVTTEEEVKEALVELKKEYHDARHHCYAYILGRDADQWRANDDGEPSHSAGDPILGQIKSHHLTNVLVVVVRYFGGTKLGVSGLINAYKTASSDALGEAKMIKTYTACQYKIETNYEDYNSILPLNNLSGFKVVEETYGTGTITLKIQIYEKDKMEIARLEKELYSSKFCLIIED